jgi:hypothetical protein
MPVKGNEIYINTIVQRWLAQELGDRAEAEVVSKGGLGRKEPCDAYDWIIRSYMTAISIAHMYLVPQKNDGILLIQLAVHEREHD